MIGKTKLTILRKKEKKELVDKLKELISCDFEIIEHFAGVRTYS